VSTSEPEGRRSSAHGFGSRLTRRNDRCSSAHWRRVGHQRAWAIGARSLRRQEAKRVSHGIRFDISHQPRHCALVRAVSGTAGEEFGRCCRCSSGRPRWALARPHPSVVPGCPPCPDRQVSAAQKGLEGRGLARGFLYPLSRALLTAERRAGPRRTASRPGVRCGQGEYRQGLEIRPRRRNQLIGDLT
jgi:hypothetical protein